MGLGPNGAKKAIFWVVLRPKGAEGLSPGFKPVETDHPQRHALKGRKIERNEHIYIS